MLLDASFCVAYNMRKPKREERPRGITKESNNDRADSQSYLERGTHS
jgi:hypothetical protein